MSQPISQHKKLTLAFCENFLPEAKAVLEQSGFPEVNLISWKPCCEHPPKNWDELTTLLDVENGTPLLIVGACFPQTLPEPSKPLGDIQLIRLEQCFHLLSGRTQVNALVREGGYLVSPGWLVNWQNQLERWGFDQEHARIFYNDTARKIILLDTGVIQNAGSQAEEFADYVGLPFLRIDIGLDFIAQYLKTLILEWQNTTLQKDLKINREHTANHAMALTLLDGITGKTSEDEAIKGVETIFRSLFAPQQTRFIYNTELSRDRTNQPDKTADLSTDYRSKLGTEKFLVHESGDGFSVALQTQESIIGYLVIDQIAFPNYLNQYLNLAISIAPLCALAIDKARVSEKMYTEMFELAALSNQLGDKNQQLERTNQQLKTSEENLKDREESINLLLNSISEGVCGLNLDGICTSCNQSALNLLGYEEHNLIGQPLHDLIAHTNREGLRRPKEESSSYKAVASGQPIYNDDTLLWKADGSWFAAESRAIPIFQDGQIMGSVFSFIDTTHKKRMLEERFRASQLASLGELAAGMAHEINNPITGVINYAQLLLNRHPEENQNRDILTRIIKESNRVATIVHNLLGFAHKDNNEMSQIKIKDIVNEPLQMVTMQLDRDGIFLDVKIDDDLEEIDGNAQRLGQIMLNLISNARYALNEKFSEQHPDKILRISACGVEREGDLRLQLTVWDQGCGIPEENLKKIFNPFFTTKAAGVGTGLGLSISHDILVEHGATVHAESAVGQFTKIVIEFPVAKEYA